MLSAIRALRNEGLEETLAALKHKTNHKNQAPPASEHIYGATLVSKEVKGLLVGGAEYRTALPQNFLYDSSRLNGWCSMLHRDISNF
jgi:hypothetical protein